MFTCVCISVCVYIFAYMFMIMCEQVCAGMCVCVSVPPDAHISSARPRHSCVIHKQPALYMCISFVARAVSPISIRLRPAHIQRSHNGGHYDAITSVSLVNNLHQPSICGACAWHKGPNGVI